MWEPKCCRSVVVVLLAAGMWCAGEMPARANDTIAGGFGSDLVPLRSEHVRMLSEDILIRYLGRPKETPGAIPMGDFGVTAEYRFVNTAAVPITLQVGFPEYACEAGDPKTDDVMCHKSPLGFQSMVTTVDGQVVQHRKGSFKKDHPWMPRLGQVWLFDVRFEPGRETRITHTYTVKEGLISDGTAVGRYITRTGASWAGSIGQARLRIQMPTDIRKLTVEGAEGLRRTLHLVEVDGLARGELLLEASEWEPSDDIGFWFRPGPIPMFEEALMSGAKPAAAGDASQPHCHDLYPLWIHARSIVTPWDGTTPRAIEAADAVRFYDTNIGDLRHCRNYIFALYGRKFEDAALNRYFYGPAGFVPGTWPFEPFEPNPNYAEKLLTAPEWGVLKLLGFIEAARTSGEAIDARPADHTGAQTAAKPAPVHKAESAPDRALPSPGKASNMSTTMTKQPATSCAGCRVITGHASGAPFAGLLTALLLMVRARRRRTDDG